MSNEHHTDGSRGFLGRLIHDVRANTMAIMAAALIPLTGLIGGGLDISRLYITKTRLQHACDAAALAGRKAMGGGRWEQNNYYPNSVAVQFFDGNFRTGSYTSTGLTRTFTENAGKVTGTVSATVPMTLMRVLGKTSETLTVTCDAEQRLPNTDVMFVLDTTGSMGQKAVSTDTETKIEGLRTAVKCFYEIVARYDTDANCTTGTPSGGTGSQTQIRFGFVPYSTNVNVGKLLPTEYFVDQAPYQTREAVYGPTTVYDFPTQGTPTLISTTNGPQTTGSSSVFSTSTVANSTACTNSRPANSTPAADGPAGAPYGGVITQNGSTQTETYKVDTPYFYYTYSTSYRSSTKVCTISRRKVTYTQTQTYSRTDDGVPRTVTVFKGWHYGQINVNVSPLKNGSGVSWNSQFPLAIAANGGQRVVDWDGCIEERQTVSQTSYSPIPAGAKDLDIDLAPDVNDDTTRWRPALPQLTFLRKIITSYAEADRADVPSINVDYYNNFPYYCPTEARKLQSWPTASTFGSYVDSLTPSGNTYHDIGMLWGARLMSPTGIFGSENALTPQGGEIDRHLIFMTDGDAVSTPCDYSAYGVHFFDRRTTTDVGSASSCGQERTALDDQINARLVALCTAVKNKNITLWVISFGSGSNTTTESRLSNCASPGRYFTARNSASLQTTFANIANQISQLRLTG